MVEVSAEVRVKAGEKYKTEILPHLQQLAGKLQTMMESEGQRVNLSQLVASLKLNMLKFWMIWSIVWQCCRGEGGSFHGGLLGVQ